MKILYQRVLKPILFRFDPERVHDVFVGLGELLGRFGVTRRLAERVYGYRSMGLGLRVGKLILPGSHQAKASYRMCRYIISTTSSYICSASWLPERIAAEAQCLRWFRTSSRPTLLNAC
ncbi:hypothetical protein BH23GEM6_BH23GEM6_23340 [soil metagenome]